MHPKQQVPRGVLPALAIGTVLAICCEMAAISQSPASQSQIQKSGAPAEPSNGSAGIWQGTLHGNPDQHLKLRITQVAGGQYKLTLYLVDRSGQSFEATRTTFSDGRLAFSIEMIGSKYEGQIDPDGKTIAGNWTWVKAATSLPLVLVRTTEEAAWPTPEPVRLMASDAHPRFDIATIKRSQLSEPGKGFGYSDGTHTTTWHTSVDDLIAVAYGLHTKQIIGAPEWVGTDLYDIDGKADVPGKASVQQISEMLQGLLADRFALKFHREQRELSVYAIQVATGGPKMKETAAEPNDPQRTLMPSFGDLYVGNLTMKQFANWMQTAVMDRPVVDRTGLNARYDFHLKWTPDASQYAQFRGTNLPVQLSAGEYPSAPPNLYTALQEQLGLKFTLTRLTVDVMVIDRVGKPSPN